MDRQIEQAARESYHLRMLLQQGVEVQSEAGVVTLKGKVQDIEQKALAEEAVRALPGVVQVENELDIHLPGRERGDGWLELKIRGLLLLRSNVSTRQTHVSVEDGIVTLSGVAENAAQRDLIEALARNVEGVKDVRNELRVRTAGALARNGRVGDTRAGGVTAE